MAVSGALGPILLRRQRFVIRTKVSENPQKLWGAVSDAGGWLQHGLELCNVGSTDAQKLANGDQAIFIAGGLLVLLSCCRQSVFFSLEPNAGEVVLFRPARTYIFLKV